MTRPSERGGASRPRVLVVDDEASFRALYSRTLSEAGFEVETAASGDAALVAIAARPPALVVSDVRMPGTDGLVLLEQVRATHPELPFLLVTAFAAVREAVAALKLGVVDYLAKPVDLDELVACVEDALGLPMRGRDVPEVPPEVLGDLVAASPAMLALVRDAYDIAQGDSTVLLTGESGAGKDVLAQLLHRASPRRQGPLVSLNCAAIPATLLASQLFGHERGSFTGADARQDGLFRQADGGTLFLDEIGELPLELQPTLLRALENRKILPLGGMRELPVNIRIVAATNRPLADDVAAGRFRADLYYRLNVIALEVPPLRERTDDIVPLARHFLARGGDDKKRLSRAAIERMTSYAWPGNVRELANAMERARVLSRTEVILPDHLPPPLRVAPREDAALPRPAVSSAPVEQAKTLAAAEEESIRRALFETHGNRTRAAELLGITRRGLINKLKRLALDLPPGGRSKM